jgi:Spy/CpxP family protein refolding chaperone
MIVVLRTDLPKTNNKKTQWNQIWDAFRRYHNSKSKKNIKTKRTQRTLTSK